MKRGKRHFKPRTEVRLAPNLGSEEAGFAMKQERFSVEQIAAVLKQTEAVMLFRIPVRLAAQKKELLARKKKLKTSIYP